MEDARRHVIDALHVVTFRCADLDAIHPGDVGLVHCPERQHGRSAGLAGSEVEALAQPHDSVEGLKLGHAPFAPAPVGYDTGPPNIIVPRRVPGWIRSARRIVCAPPMGRDPIPLPPGLLGRMPVNRQQVEIAVIAAEPPQPGLTDPGLDERAAPGGLDEADRHAHDRLQVAAEEIADGGELADTRRTRDLPAGPGAKCVAWHDAAEALDVE